MSFDPNSFLQEMVRAGVYTQAEADAAATYFEKASSKIGEGYLRQSDYSRQMNELQEKIRAEDEYAAQLAKFDEELKQRAAQFNNPYGVQTATPPAATPPPQVPALSPEALKGYVKADEAQKALMDSFTAQVELLDIAQEHQAKFGQPLPRYGELVNEALSKKQPLREVWREKFNVGQRERELQEQDVQRRIDEALAAERQKWMTQTSLDGGRPAAGVSSPFLDVLREGREGSSAQRSNERVQAAVADFQQRLSQNR